ncbi:MAG: substrate-binding domain-containing protein [Pseudomonadota bacterium]
MKYLLKCLAAVFAFAMVASTASADTIRMAVTTSFHNSGLSDVLLPEIQKDLGLEVQLLVVGTGQALKLGRQGDVDVVLVHSRKAEEKFIEEGFGIRRTEIMYNDFVFIGPKADPANLSEAGNAAEAMTQIADKKANFVSRGDDSGTHKREVSLWKGAGLEPENFDSAWYREVGAGMGAALNIAAGMDAYILSDRASWLNFKNKAGLDLVYAGDPNLFNQYALLMLNKERHPHVKLELAERLESWLVSERAQALIGAYEISGETLFVPNAKPLNQS